MVDSLEDRESDFKLVSNTERVVFQPNHPLMAKPKKREQDLRQQDYFFYKRLTDDQILCFSEGEAAFMMKGTHRFILRQIGVSNGQAYRAFINNCGVKPGQVIPIAQAQEILNGAMNAEIEAAKGHYREPDDQNVHFDNSFPVKQRGTFVPPA